MGGAKEGKAGMKVANASIHEEMLRQVSESMKPES